ncbi:protein kinase, putative [Plasmodium malariae]|uniref:Protein kinase, putative n=1 Tax=Plasmodium malariae TaxID=5858 RepID=A0A1A8WW66_PLAMA|nr:protein kinase, putative [Plasmodium malariae]SBS96591.1 protein kinase, putative [Plasmodium malariae]SBT87913.1 protein kinase, putative [Plasmodium malariae]
MKRITREDILLKYKDKDDFVYYHLHNILTLKPFNELIEYENGDTYIGTTEKRRRHGYGYYIYKDSKSIYQGIWKENTKSGFGILYNEKEVIYSGEWLNNISHGFGCSYKNDELFFGGYKYGLMNGVGILKKNTSFNFCLFQSNRKKCLIKITKYMKIYLYLYKNNKILFKEKLNDFFPFYMNSNIPNILHEQIFRKLLSVDEWSRILSSKYYKVINTKQQNSPGKNDFLSYINYKSRIIFRKGMSNETELPKEENKDFNVHHYEYAWGNRSDAPLRCNDKLDVETTRDANNEISNSNDSQNDFLSYNNLLGSFYSLRTMSKLASEKCDISYNSCTEDEERRFHNSSLQLNKMVPCESFNEKHLYYRSDSSSSTSDFYMDVTFESSSSFPSFKKKSKIKIPYRHISIYGNSKIRTGKRRKKKDKKKYYKLLIGEYNRKRSQLKLDGYENCTTIAGVKRNENVLNSVRSNAYSNNNNSGNGINGNGINGNSINGNSINGNSINGNGINGNGINGSDNNNNNSNSSTDNNDTTFAGNNIYSSKKGKKASTYLHFLTYLKEINRKKKIECIYQWHKHHVSILLYLFKLHKYIPSFNYNNIKGFHFFTLNSKILRQLGVQNKEHIYFLMNFINIFNNIHNVYLQMLIKWTHVKKDFLLTYNSLNKKKFCILKNLRNAPNMYLCYYHNAPVCLKIVSSKTKKTSHAKNCKNEQIKLNKYAEGDCSTIYMHEQEDGFDGGTRGKRIAAHYDREKAKINMDIEAKIIDDTKGIARCECTTTDCPEYSEIKAAHELGQYDEGQGSDGKNGKIDEMNGKNGRKNDEKDITCVSTNFKNDLLNAAQNFLFNEKLKINFMHNFENIKKNVLKFEMKTKHKNEEESIYARRSDMNASIHPPNYDNTILENKRYVQDVYNEKLLTGQYTKVIKVVNYGYHKNVSGSDTNNTTNSSMDDSGSSKSDYNNDVNNYIEKLKCKMAFIKEHFIISNLRHANFVKYIGNITSRKKEKFGLVFEYLRGKYLHDFIYYSKSKKKKCTLKNRKIIKLFYEISVSLRYMHDKYIYHGNINSKNIFITNKGNIKICNFQYSSIGSYYDYKGNTGGRCDAFGKHNSSNVRRNMSSNNDSNSRNSRSSYNFLCDKMCLPLPYITSVNYTRGANVKSSPLLQFHTFTFDNRKANYADDAYVAPEVLREEEYTDKSDIYSFGILMYEVLFETLPFKNESIPLFFLISTGYYQKYINFDINKLYSKFDGDDGDADNMFHVSINIMLIIKECLNPEPCNRPSSKYLCSSFKYLLDLLTMQDISK